MSLYILKLGGSVITDKKGNKFAVNKSALKKLANVISNSISGDSRLILVHGAGPFGHKMVKDYGIANGISTKKHLEGIAKTHNSMETLDKQVIEALLDAGVNAITIQPSACIIQDNKKIVKFDTEQIEKFLSLGLVPVLYGDMVLDKSLGSSVVSGDAIISYLAGNLAVAKVFLGTDVEGIFDSDPHKNRKAKLIEEINPSNIADVFSKASESSAVDVTSGMKGKLSEIANSIKGKECFIFKLTPNNLSSLLSGRKIRCTRLYF